MGMRGPLKQTTAPPRGQLLKKIPKPLSGLGPAGRAEWRRVAAELGPKGRNALTVSAIGLLEDLARVVDDAEQFRAAWQKEGLTVIGKGREFAHPMIVAERAARQAVNQLRRELGVTPSTALRVPSGPPPAETETGFEDVD
jgi:phage terminase small subunit